MGCMSVYMLIIYTGDFMNERRPRVWLSLQLNGEFMSFSWDSLRNAVGRRRVALSGIVERQREGSFR